MTFEFLKQISNRVYERYLTLEKNIKSASNSFYDSYLDLQEELLRQIVADFDIEIISRRSFGELLKIKEIESIFYEELKLNQYTYEKMMDYSLKVNSHKHKGEKKIELETVYKYLTVFYEVSSTYARYRGFSYEFFDRSYFEEIFDFFEKENLQLKRQLEDYREIVEESNLNYAEKEKYRLLLSYSEINTATLEEQNDELRKRIDELNTLKDHIDSRFDKIDERLNQIERGNQPSYTRKLSKAEYIMLNSKKEYMFGENKTIFLKWKIAISVSFFSLLVFGILSTYYATKYFQLYSTFTLFENIYFLLTIYMFVYVLKSKQFYEVNKYKNNTIEKFHYDSYGVPRRKTLKKKYRVFFIISIISSIAHLFLGVYEKNAYSKEMIFCEALFVLFSVVYYVLVRKFFDRYFMILHTVKIEDGKTEKYIDDGITSTFYYYKET